MRKLVGVLTALLGTTLAGQAGATNILEEAARKERMLTILYWAGFALIVSLVAVFIVRNIRLRRRLKSENRRYAVAMNSAYDSVAELDLTNRAWYELSMLNGLLRKSKMHESLDLYMERFIREHVYKDDMPIFRALFAPEKLKNISDDEASEYYEFRQVSPKGNPYWCSLMVQGLRKSRGDPAVVVLYIRSIDDIKREEAKNQERLTEALKNAERLSRVKTDFMSRISHEIRTPLNAIMGFISIGKQNIDDRPKLENCLNKADIASHHLLSLVGDILDISAIENGKLKLDNHLFNFREFINNLGSIYFEQAKEKGIEFNIRFDTLTEEYLISDNMRFNQVLGNLLSNALKFTERGGHVTLTIKQSIVKDDSVNMTFVVADDGIGMKEGYMERIFRAFEQEERASSRKYGGTGLGLSIAKNTIDVMGGSMDVQSKLGEGSTFTVSIPMGRNRCEIADDAKRRAYATLRMLIIDDDQSSLEYASMLLKKLNIAHDSAISGEVALEKAKAALDDGKPYDLFLIDWRMPGMSGCETAQKLGALMGDRARIVVLTGYDQSAIEAEAQGLLVSRFLMKPLFQSTLVDLLGDLMGKQEITVPADAKPAPDLHGKRVLLVEDNELNREIAMELLQELGLEVETAEDGKQGFDIFNASEPGHFQLVLMDIQMPVMNGHDATRAIRASAHPDGKTIPVVAMTANAFPEDVSQSLAAGMNNHLAKPIDLEKMHTVLNEYLG